MFDSSLIFNTLAFGFSLAMYPFVIRAIRHGEPTTIATWLSWLAMDLALLAGQCYAGTVSWQLVAYALGTSAVLVTCYAMRTPVHWGLVDIGCTAATLVGAVWWLLTGDVEWATLIELGAMTAASIPLFLHFWRSPQPIRAAPWLCNFIGAVWALGAIKSYDLIGAGPTVTFLVLSTLFNFAVARTFRNSKFVSQVLMRD